MGGSFEALLADCGVHQESLDDAQRQALDQRGFVLLRAALAPTEADAAGRGQGTLHFEGLL